MKKKKILTKKLNLQNSPHKFGTFIGVFTPSILTILGVIMYLRFGWMIGNAGLINAIIIVSISTIITFITSLSVSAVATNMKVGVGGEYFLISRSLGLELGGAIGIPLYMARAVSVTLYAFGLAESLRFVWPSIPIQPTAAIVILVITIISAKSASLTLKLQIPLMIAVFLSIFVMAIGVLGNPQTAIIESSYQKGIDFWVVFAVFFPAVTGFTAGVGLSGDLKDPSRSIPRGSIGAVVCGYIIYIVVSILLAFAASRFDLQNNSLIWQKVSIVSFLILPGMWGAILSSAIGSILAGPRVIQALASDGVAPSFIGKVSKKNGEPMIAIWLTGGISLLGVLLGDLNTIAPVVTIFFLTFYASINLVSGLEVLIGDPSYRPKIKIPWYISFLAAIGSIVVMFLINRIACFAAITIELIVWFWLRRRALKATFGDLRRGLWYSLMKTSLENLKLLPPNPRDWRPHILLFAGNVKKRLELVQLADWLNQKRGIITVCDLKDGNLEDFHEDMSKQIEDNNDFLRDKGVNAFYEVMVVPDFIKGVEMIIQSNGIAGLNSNTIMFGWSSKPHRLARYLKIMRHVGHLGKSTIISKISFRPKNARSRQIDIWWRGEENNGDMMLLLAHLISLNPEWKGGKIVLKSVAKNKKEKEVTQESLKHLLPRIRIKAETNVIMMKKDQTLSELIKKESGVADIVFMGLAEPKPRQELAYARRIFELVEDLPTVILVKNSSYFSGKLV